MRHEITLAPDCDHGRVNSNCSILKKCSPVASTTKTKYSISEAHRIAGKSRTTITTHIKSGKLSVTEHASGSKLIDASELLRVYGDDCDFERAAAAAKPSGKTNKDSSGNCEQGIHGDLQFADQLLNNERKEREREREQLQSQIEYLESALSQAQEGHNRATLLLEDHTSGIGDWEQTFRNLERKVADQEEAFREEREAIKNAKRRAEHYKRALQEEQNKSLWQKLFG